MSVILEPWTRDQIERAAECARACQGVEFTGPDPTGSVRRLIEAAQAANFAAQVNPKLWAMHEALEAALAAFTLEEKQS